SKPTLAFPGDQLVRSRAAAAIFLALRRASLARSAGVADRADMRPVLRRNLKYASRASTVASDGNGSVGPFAGTSLSSRSCTDPAGHNVGSKSSYVARRSSN